MVSIEIPKPKQKLRNTTNITKKKPQKVYLNHEKEQELYIR